MRLHQARKEGGTEFILGTIQIPFKYLRQKTRLVPIQADKPKSILRCDFGSADHVGVDSLPDLVRWEVVRHFLIYTWCRKNRT